MLLARFGCKISAQGTRRNNHVIEYSDGSGLREAGFTCAMIVFTRSFRCEVKLAKFGQAVRRSLLLGSERKRQLASDVQQATEQEAACTLGQHKGENI